MLEIKVPTLPESISEGTLGQWHKKVGERIAVDENLVDLETDKVVLEIPSTSAGLLTEIRANEGDTVVDGQILAVIDTSVADSTSPPSEAPAPAPAASAAESVRATAPEAAPAMAPAAKKLAAEQNINPAEISGTGKRGQILKKDVIAHQAAEAVSAPAAPATSSPAAAAPATPPPPPPMATAAMAGSDDRRDERVPMTRLRQRVAERLKQAQNTSAMLTTFNEVNLQAVMKLRQQYRDTFEKAHDVRLGFMSFFTKASVEALKRFPAVNASIDGSDIVYHNYFDIGIAVSSDRGLVVPVLRNADQLSYAEIEQGIRELSTKAQQGKLGLDDLVGGTFSITNGGVFGSMLSTPILNPPQSAILGMHSIQERPVVENGEIVIRPMMYLALTYDHRIIDGREAVQFLVTIKQVLEDPARLLLQI